MNLPDLNAYLSAFKKMGIAHPLPAVPAAAEGLLQQLPPPPAGKTGWPWDTQTNPAVYDKSISWPKLTIVTPSYNQGQFIEQTIRSILLQNYPNLEYIVIDGGSNDSTRAILERYSPWISYWQCEKDNGQSHAINLGFSLAGGDYYAWINSDDFYLEGVFEKVIRTFVTQQTEFVYGYSYNLNIADNQQELIKVPPLHDYFIKIPTLMQPACFWKAGIHEPIWEEMHCAMDYELWLRLVKGHKRTRIRQPLAVAHVHGDAKTFDPKMKAKWDADQAKMWSAEGHGPVPEWKRITFLHRLRLKIYKLLKFV